MKLSDKFDFVYSEPDKKKTEKSNETEIMQDFLAQRKSMSDSFDVYQQELEKFNHLQYEILYFKKDDYISKEMRKKMKCAICFRLLKEGAEILRIELSRYKNVYLHKICLLDPHKRR